ncbi:antiterminator LoaP [Clostridium frigidicarnis]|uniref:Transcriptional antiterminator NusG n=1 Tax=Clostridium frigidicarnis TaxID=84698 RepID=A0A1I0Y3M7_9CLOT|nr:antiterminator LoaP [Clostridium frigidicarnis]SFB07784.1 transcriptional antiterminator NusG [Clostridium frigidicarnis]
MYWYALFVQTGKEETVSKHIKMHLEDCITTLIPKRIVPEKRNNIWLDVEKKLFPGYILLYTYMDNKKYHILKQIPYVIKLLTTSPHYLPITEDEISLILNLVNKNGIIEYSKISCQNSIITVLDGPLKGYERLIKKLCKHSKRIKVQINFINKTKVVDLGIEIANTSK